MRRVVISHSQLPKGPQVSLFHTQTSQKLNRKLVMLSAVQDWSPPCSSHPAFVAAELRNSSPGAPGPMAALPRSSSLRLELERHPATAPGVGHRCPCLPKLARNFRTPREPRASVGVGVGTHRVVTPLSCR